MGKGTYLTRLKFLSKLNGCQILKKKTLKNGTVPTYELAYAVDAVAYVITYIISYAVAYTVIYFLACAVAYAGVAYAGACVIAYVVAYAVA